jgi:hypothetical protein
VTWGYCAELDLWVSVTTRGVVEFWTATHAGWYRPVNDELAWPL